jgi:hypothetical protein
MYRFGLLVVLPFVLGGGMSPGSHHGANSGMNIGSNMNRGSHYGASSGSHGANSGMNINMNRGSSGTNARMSPNGSNMRPQQPNQPNANGGGGIMPGRRFQSDLPYREFSLNHM